MSFILDKSDQSKLQRKGAKIVGATGEKKSEIDILREISAKLTALLNKPSEPREIIQSAEAPVVNVQPTPVTVNLPEKQEPKKWKFDLSKNDKGQTTEIIATAIE